MFRWIQVCGEPSTTRPKECKAPKYCSSFNFTCVRSSLWSSQKGICWTRKTSWSYLLFQPSRSHYRTPVVTLEYLRRQCCYTVPLPWSKVLPHELKSPTLASGSCKTLVRDCIAIFFGDTPVTDAKGSEILTLSSQPEDVRRMG